MGYRAAEGYAIGRVEAAERAEQRPPSNPQLDEGAEIGVTLKALEDLARR